MKKGIISVIKLADQVLSQLYLTFFQESNSLITFLFHGLFDSEKEISLNLADPQQGITVEHFRQFVEYYLDHDYTFISPNDILNGLDNHRKYILITFDDGRFNNQRALPILREYRVPAVFFISTNYVKYNKCFWPDVLYKGRIRQGMSIEDIWREVGQLKSKASEEIEKYLTDIFGQRALKPISDIDRPFTPSELKEFSKEKYVFLGNHTSGHPILTNCSLTEIKSQILSAQNTIYDITRITPIIISYPWGSYSNEVIRISKEIGLKLGLTVDFKKNHLPLDCQGNDFMRLGRFVLWGNSQLIKQCEVLRSDIVLYNWIHNRYNQIRSLSRRKH